MIFRGENDRIIGGKLSLVRWQLHWIEHIGLLLLLVCTDAMIRGPEDTHLRVAVLVEIEVAGLPGPRLQRALQLFVELLDYRLRFMAHGLVRVLQFQVDRLLVYQFKHRFRLRVHFLVE